MARIFPFRPYRYSAAAGPLNRLVTQPYDKITPEMQARYLSLSPYNLVRLILGERFPTDSETNNVYTRAAAYLDNWISRGILEQESEPSLYAYFQEFVVPDTGEKLVRKGFIGLGAVEDYSAGVVYRHEQTLSGPKKDRLELLNHTHTHFGHIFMLYPDREAAIDRILDQEAARQPDVCVEDEYGEFHRVWRISNPAVISRLQKLMADKKLLIADGHHRYETALAFCQQNPHLPGADKVMMTFVNMYSPGLRILGAHRVVRGMDSFSLDALLRGASKSFRIQHLPDLAALHVAWEEPHTDLIRIGVVASAGHSLYLLETDRKGRLDVNVLHEELLRDVLGITDEEVREEKYLEYVRGVHVAADRVRNGSTQAAFLLEPPSIDQVAEISFSGGVMPQKSTDFYPKLLSGLTLYKLD